MTAPQKLQDVRIAAVDLNKRHAAFAYRRRDGSWHYGKHALDSMMALEAVAKDFYAAGIRFVVTEHPYLGKNPDALSAISFLAGILYAYCRAHGIIPIPLVYAATWQASVLTGPRNREDLKRSSMFYAGALVRRKIECDDIADAICMAHWAESQLRTQTPKSLEEMGLFSPAVLHDRKLSKTVAKSFIKNSLTQTIR